MKKNLIFLIAVVVMGVVLLPAAIAQDPYCKCGTPKCKYEHQKQVLPHLNPGGSPMTPAAPRTAGQRAAWEYMGPEGGTFAFVVTDPTDADAAIIINNESYGNGNVYETADGGANWTAFAKNPFAMFDFFAADMNTWYAVGMDYTTYMPYFGVTTDGGITWTNTAWTGTDTPYAVRVHPTNPNTIYVAGYYYNMVGPHLYEPVFSVSTDGGVTWTSTNLSSFGYMVPFGFDVSSNNPNVMYMAGYDYDISTYMITGMCLASTDGGTTWTAAPVSAIPFEYSIMVAIDPTDDNHVIAPGTGYFESFDGGATWTTNPNGPTFAYGLDIHPTDSNTIYVAASDGMFQTTDGGATWTLTDVGGMPYTPSICEGTPSTVYCACYYTGITRTVDSGVTWTNICNGILESRVYGVEISDSSPNGIYSSPYGFAAFQKSGDSGVTWTELPMPPEATYVSIALENSNAPNIILAVLPGG